MTDAIADASGEVDAKAVEIADRMFPVGLNGLRAAHDVAPWNIARKAARAALDLTAGAPAADVIALVCAARGVMDLGGTGDAEVDANLDTALEPFASRVCYDDDSGDLPEAHADPCTCGSGPGATA